MGQTHVGTYGNWDLTDRECRVRHGQNHTDDVVGVFVDVLCNKCKQIACNEGGFCTGLISTWDAPFINSCGTDANNATLSCHGGDGAPIEKLCNEAMEATVCDFSPCTYDQEEAYDEACCTFDDAKCLFDRKNNDHFYYGTCRVDNPGWSPDWIGVFGVVGFFVGVAIIVLLGWYVKRWCDSCREKEKREKRDEAKWRKRMLDDTYAIGYRQPRTNFNMVRSDSV